MNGHKHEFRYYSHHCRKVGKVEVIEECSTCGDLRMHNFNYRAEVQVRVEKLSNALR